MKLYKLFHLALASSMTVILVMGCSAGEGEPAPVASPASSLSAVSPTATPPSPDPAPTPTPVDAPSPPAFAGVPGIVDPSHFGWPREVRTSGGVVTIAAQPQRIHTVSLGHDEVTYALVPADRVVAVGAFTKEPEYSNVAEMAQQTETVGRNAEQIIARQPDIVLASPFSNADLLNALRTVGITVVQTELRNDPDGRIQDILLLGYIYGEEERALALAAEVQSRQDALASIAAARPVEGRPRVLSIARFTDSIGAAGRDTTEESIIEAAGGINAASEFERNQTVSLEGIIAMSPDVIILTQPLEGALALREDLLHNPALAAVPAIVDRQVHPVPPKLFTTLSFWNLKGAEELARILWPGDFPDTDLPDFTLSDQSG